MTSEKEQGYILVVDDDKLTLKMVAISFLRKIVKEILSSDKEENAPLKDFLEKHEITERTKILRAENGIEAFEACKNHNVVFVITDLNMPVQRGDEFVRDLRANERKSGKECLVLSMSGAEKDKPQSGKQAENLFKIAGANAFITKSTLIDDQPGLDIGKVLSGMLATFKNELQTSVGLDSPVGVEASDAPITGGAMASGAGSGASSMPFDAPVYRASTSTFAPTPAAEECAGEVSMPPSPMQIGVAVGGVMLSAPLVNTSVHYAHQEFSSTPVAVEYAGGVPSVLPSTRGDAEVARRLAWRTPKSELRALLPGEITEVVSLRNERVRNYEVLDGFSLTPSAMGGKVDSLSPMLTGAGVGAGTEVAGAAEELVGGGTLAFPSVHKSATQTGAGVREGGGVPSVPQRDQASSMSVVSAAGQNSQVNSWQEQVGRKKTWCCCVVS